MQLRKMLSLEITKFIFIGVLNTIVGYIIFSIVYFTFNNEIVSLLFAYILGIMFNFKTYSKYVFTSSDKQIFINFIFIYLGSFLINSILLKIFINMIYLNPYLSQFILILIVTPILYLLQKKNVFIKDKEFYK